MKWWIALVALMCVALSTGPALAQQAQGQGLMNVEPTDPSTGYPSGYQDKKGLTLAQCLVFPTDPQAPVPDPCGLIGTVPNDNAPIVFPTNFPDESFYSRAVAVINNVGAGGVGKATLVHALEGAFGGATLTVADGNGAQVVFARLRIRVTAGLTPGATYTVTHPYGVDTFIASDTGTINFTSNQGCGLVPPACNFGNVLTSSNVGPFLTWDTFKSPPPVGPPAGFIGDPAISHAITGSPLGTNFFRIDGPDIGGTGVNSIQTNLFVIVGKLFAGTGIGLTPLTVDRTSYIRTANAQQINVFVHSTVGATVTASGTQLARDSASGRFFASIPLGSNATLPTSIPITASDPLDSPFTLNSPLVDDVTIDSATYDTTTQTLTIKAHSSDQTSPPTLTADGGPLVPLGTLDATGTLAKTMTVPPEKVNVTSSAGGKDSRAVAVAAINPAVTTLGLAASPNPSTVGQAVTFTATVSGGTGTPTGTITFRDGATPLGVANVANRSAAFTVSTLAAGAHTITAAYSGDALFLSSTSAPLTQTVNPVPPPPNPVSTTTTLTASPNPVPAGGSTTLKATVTATTPGAGTPIGTVTFVDTVNGVTSPLGTATLSAGVATLTQSFTPGVHSIRATYNGSANFTGSTSATLAVKAQ